MWYMNLTTLLFTFIMLFKGLKDCLSMPRQLQRDLPGSRIIDESPFDEDTNPSHVRKVHLYSKQGHYIAILEDGTVTATLNRSSPDAILEMQSYGVKQKRIRRPNSDWWLGIDKRGRIRTRNKKRKDTMFYESHDGLWLWYENKYGYVLAFRKNFQPKHNVTDLKGKKSKFLIMGLNSMNIKPDGDKR